MNSFQKFLKILAITPRIGISNVSYMVYYRVALNTGLRSLKFKEEKFVLPERPLFEFKKFPINSYPYDSRFYRRIADGVLRNQFVYFFKHFYIHPDSVDWTYDPFSKRRLSANDMNWTRVQDFGLETGDIKNLWELGRFYWLTDLALAASLENNRDYLLKLNELVSSFFEENDLNRGVHWRCGQEVAIRVINIILVADYLLNADDRLDYLVLKHIERIYHNIHYGIVQQNNHGVSEAAALIIGGLFLKDKYEIWAKYYNHGLQVINGQLKKLVAKDGSFSQHSTNYHRVMLDMVSLVEVYARKHDKRVFAQELGERLARSTEWLLAMIDEKFGTVPNLGANDGARILNFNSLPYEDFRPTIQLASCLFRNRRVFNHGLWDEPLYWLSNDLLEKEIDESRVQTVILDESYYIHKNEKLRLILKLANFKFRPKHNDVFHCDVTFDGVNYLCDSGSYSYYLPDGAFFKKTAAHNTITLNGEEQMPLLGRFMLGDWIKPSKILNDQSGEIGFVYTKSNGLTHTRRLRVDGRKVRIEDTVSGNIQNSVLHWHTPFPLSSLLRTADTVEVANMKLKFQNANKIVLSEARVSRFYNSFDDATRIDVHFDTGKIITYIEFLE